MHSREAQIDSADSKRALIYNTSLRVLEGQDTRSLRSLIRARSLTLADLYTLANARGLAALADMYTLANARR
jgi:hypothetical protein